MATAKSSRVSAEWRKVLKALPGYDPFAHSEGYWFDEEAAQLACDFFPQCLQHIEGSAAGNPFELEPWQKSFVANLFGWKSQAGTRRYREAMLYVARGNGKSPLAAGIALYMLFCDGEPGAQIYLVASESEQAAIIYRHARGMVEREPFLSERAKIFKGQGHRSIILHSDVMSSIRVVSADAGGKHGYAPHAVIGDELHAWNDRELLDALETAFAKKGRKQPLKLWLTTADYDRESPCNDKYDYACAVRDNKGDESQPGYDPSFLPAIFEAKQEADWTNEKVWELANPNMDVTVDRERLREECRKAQEQPVRQAEFKRLHLNIRTTAQTIFIPLERWDKCGGPIDMPNGSACYGGLDISAKQDVTAGIFVFPPPPRASDDPFVVHAHFWVPAENMRERERVDRVPYSVWVQQGLVTAVPGNMIDEQLVEDWVLQYAKKYRIVECGFDAWNALGLANRLISRGVSMVQVPQTVSHLSGGTKAVDDLTAQGKLAHGNNPVLRWMMSCAEVIGDKNQNLRPVKPERRTGKRIDGVMALVMALGRAVLRPAQVKSVYETRGIIYA